MKIRMVIEATEKVFGNDFVVVEIDGDIDMAYRTVEILKKHLSKDYKIM